MDSKIIIAIASALVGFAFSFILQAAKQRWNRREVLADWFEERYIIEGFDPLIAFCTEIRDLLAFQIGQYQQGHHPKEVARWTMTYLNQTTVGDGLMLPREAIGTVSTLSETTTLRSTLYLLSLPFWSMDEKVYHPRSLEQLEAVAKAVDHALKKSRNKAFHLKLSKKSDVAVFFPIDEVLEEELPLAEVQRIVRQLDAYEFDEPLADE
jgi:hypothetical protein